MDPLPPLNRAFSLFSVVRQQGRQMLGDATKILKIMTIVDKGNGK